jgi:hypothetical protein
MAGTVRPIDNPKSLPVWIIFKMGHQAVRIDTTSALNE